MLLRLVVALAVGIFVAPLSSDAQEPARVPTIGLFHIGVDHTPLSLDGLREGLKAFGYEEGKNIRLDWRNLPDEEAARAAVQEFVRDRVDVIVAFENPAVRLAKAATSDIPVIFLHAIDPRGSGFVTDLFHPDVTSAAETSASRGGNITGIAGRESEPPARQIQMFKDLVPKLRRLLLLTDPGDPRTPQLLAEARKTGQTLKLQLVEHEAGSQPDIDRILGRLARGSVDGILVVSPTLEDRFAPSILRLAAQRRIPLAGHRKESVRQGALFSYGTDVRGVGRTAVRYIDKLLKGVSLANLPVEFSQPELAVNLKTARALGLTIPRTALVRASQVSL